MVSVLPSSPVDSESTAGRGKPDNKIGMGCLSAKHTALGSKNTIRIMYPSGVTCLPATLRAVGYSY
jgi:hypothetical protein